MWITTMENASRLPQRLTHIRIYDLFSSFLSALACMVCCRSLTWLFVMLGRVRISGAVLNSVQSCYPTSIPLRDKDDLLPFSARLKAYKKPPNSTNPTTKK